MILWLDPRASTRRPYLGTYTRRASMEFWLLARNRKIASTSNEGVETPFACASGCHVQEDETEQHGGHALVLNWPMSLRKVKLPIGNGHHAGQNECNRASEETQQDQNAAKEFEHAADPRL